MLQLVGKRGPSLDLLFTEANFLHLSSFANIVSIKPGTRTDCTACINFKNTTFAKLL